MNDPEVATCTVEKDGRVRADFQGTSCRSTDFEGVGALLFRLGPKTIVFKREGAAEEVSGNSAGVAMLHVDTWQERLFLQVFVKTIQKL